PPRTAQESALSATGIVEARGGNVAVASAVPGVVAAVLVRAGQVVKEGQPLFRLRDDDLRAAVEVRLRQLRTAEARLARRARRAPTTCSPAPPESGPPGPTWPPGGPPRNTPGSSTPAACSAPRSSSSAGRRWSLHRPRSSGPRPRTRCCAPGRPRPTWSS